MSRIAPLAVERANPEQHALLEAVQTSLGMLPNFLRVFAHSPVALRAFVGLYGIAREGELDALTRERIALALAEQSGCAYCLSAHAALGRQAGLDDSEIATNRAGSSQDARAAVAVRFALALAEHRGEVTDAELGSMRAAGYSDGQIVEVITHVGLNLLTNILGKASRVEIDFPRLVPRAAAEPA